MALVQPIVNSISVTVYGKAVDHLVNLSNSIMSVQIHRSPIPVYMGKSHIKTKYCDKIKIIHGERRLTKRKMVSWDQTENAS